MSTRQDIKETSSIVGGIFLVCALLVWMIGKYCIFVEPQMLSAVTYEKKPVMATVFKEPIVIEKEVVVLIEPEVEEEPVIEEVVQPVVATYHSTAQALTGDFDITKPSNLTVAQIEKMLAGPRSGLLPQAQAIYDAEKTHGVNALYLTAVLGLESGWGKHESGTNNIAGWKGGPGGTWSNFNSRYDCVQTIAKHLGTSFVSTHGPKLSGVTKRYCPEPGYLDFTLRIMGDLNRQL